MRTTAAVSLLRTLLVFLLGGVFVAGTAANADIEIRRSWAAPGESVILVPPHAGLRRIVVEIPAPAGARLSALASWSPFDRTLSFRLARGARPALVQTSGRSPVVFGTVLDTVPASTVLWIEERSGGTETLALTLQLNWAVDRASASVPSGPTSVSVGPASGTRTSAETRSVSTASPSTSTMTEPPGVLYAAPVTVAEIGWREGGTLRLGVLQRDGLRLRFSAPVNPELARDALRLELGFPGSQEGLVRWEEVLLDVRVEASSIVARIPAKVALTRETPARLVLDGFRLLSRTGQLVDAEGTGLKLPSGDGRPGGVFQSHFRLAP